MFMEVFMKRLNFSSEQRQGVIIFALVLLASAYSLGGCKTTGSFAGGQGTQASPWKIETAKQLNEVRNHLDGYYVLGADIDLSFYANFASIGYFEPVSEEDEENPKLELAFTGVFDGNGHKISNIVINAPKQMGVGLFGCVAGDNGILKNLVVENVTVSGATQVGGVIGYGAASGTLENITLQGINSITGNFLVGGIVGGGFLNMKNCNATADVILNGDGTQGAGILAGGMEDNSFISCNVTGGSITVTGNGSFSIGALAACGQSTSEITDCTVRNVTITVGTDCFMIGGLIGHVGNGYDASYPTIIDNCTVTNVTISAPSSAERIGGIAGSGFYYSIYSAYRPNPNAFIIRNSTSSGRITGGCTKMVGKIAGYIYDNSTVEETCTSTVDGPSNNVGGDKTSFELSTLK
jgi:hypothetical protein